VSTDQVLLAILSLAVLTNFALVGVIQLRALRRRRAQERVQMALGPSLPGIDATDDEDARAAAAIEAFVGDEGTSLPIGQPRQQPFTVPSRPASAIENRGRDSIDRALADRDTWDRTLRAESERVARFGGSLTVVMAELARIDGLADRLGRTVADQVVMEVAKLLASETRGADLIASLGGGRFAVLLVATDETNAVPYIHRVRSAADRWLENAGLTISLSLGWASPPEGEQAMRAAAIAQQRMWDAGRGPSSGASPA
jgi:diguanylate cyclase (GGDEF)-like protein